MRTFTFNCTLTSYEHYYAVGTHGVTVNGGNMTVSADQSVYAVGHYDRSSGNDYSAIMVTVPALSYTGNVTGVKLRLNVSANADNAVYVGKVTNATNLANTGGIPWYTGENTGWIETGVDSLGCESGIQYSLIMDSLATNSTDIVVTEAHLVIETDTSDFTLSYNANGGTGAPASQTATGSESASFTVSSQVPTKTGYSFDGWATSADGAVACQPGDQISITNDTTLYAVWSAVTMTVTLNPSGGTVSPTSITATYGKPYGTLPTPTRTSGTFNGWYNGTSLVTATTVCYETTNHTLTAGWNALSIVRRKKADGSMEDGTIYQKQADGSMRLGIVYRKSADGSMQPNQ